MKYICGLLIGSFSIFYGYAQIDTTQNKDSMTVAVTDSLSVQDQPMPVTQVTPESGRVNTEEVYILKPKIDIPYTALGVGWSIYAFPIIYSKERSTPQQISALRREDINGFDRWATKYYSKKAADVSDLFFYGSMPLPVLLFLDKDIRKDAAKVGFLYLETMATTGILYTGAPYFIDRYRPLAYNPSPEAKQEALGGGAKNSFFGGHPALVATATFFVAKVYRDYHPESKFRHVLFGGAALATGATAYLRHRGGKHFPSDLIVGISIGTLSGILIPHFHKNPLFKNPNLSIRPFTGQSHGLSMVYKL